MILDEHDEEAIQEKASGRVASWERSLSPLPGSDVCVGAERIAESLGSRPSAHVEAFWQAIGDLPVAYVVQQVWPMLRKSKEWPEIRTSLVREEAERIRRWKLEKEDE